MLIGTTVTYFVKYFHEFINMNSDILKYLFTCEEESLLDGYKNNFYTNKNTEVNSIREEMFDYVYEQLLFVKKKPVLFVFENDSYFHVFIHHY